MVISDTLHLIARCHVTQPTQPELLHKRAAWVLMAWVLLHELLVLLY